MRSMCPCTGNYWWGSFNPELSDWEMYRWWWDRNWIWVHFLCSRGIYTTTRWGPSPDGGRGRSSRRTLLLRVRVYAPLRFTDHQLVQYTALLPRADGVETMATLRDQGGFPRGQREKLWCEFFLDPLQGGDHGSEKVTEHQFCQRVHMSMGP